MKRTMREVKALYGGEMSAHHYFRDFYYCDSGMIPFLLVSTLLSQQASSLGELVSNARKAYPCSGELNYTVTEPELLMEKIRRFYELEAISIDEVDGLSIRLDYARINVRKSNTENFLRVNIETICDEALVHQIQKTLESMIHPYLQS